MKSYGCKVIVTEIDPICALQAAMEGFSKRLEDVLNRGNILSQQQEIKNYYIKTYEKNERPSYCL